MPATAQHGPGVFYLISFRLLCEKMQSYWKAVLFTNPPPFPPPVGSIWFLFLFSYCLFFPLGFLTPSSTSTSHFVGVKIQVGRWLLCASASGPDSVALPASRLCLQALQPRGLPAALATEPDSCPVCGGPAPRWAQVLNSGVIPGN